MNASSCPSSLSELEARQSTTSLIVTMVWTSNSEDEAGAGMGPELQALLVTLGGGFSKSWSFHWTLSMGLLSFVTWERLSKHWDLQALFF